ncbi:MULTISPECIES: nucleoside triphosphate pyrophosphohydrolase [Clostridium]|uniref:Nucleoside triphosphate pyrophosphohydrolase n=1 Tax=Clostridium sporogenes TaxID=1509 RepID=A0ABX4KA97_CLOSG|nr:nucleoside triphosphate pyrophosphohydrolase [Clostridium sporogenes]AVP61623.1 nucleoside triphosphate pyrophosphohydrolase [Clostridium botulinum]MCW6060440.1 nucleoside triphosphate pyrophosphohydrolase [Clostridium sporogenes]MCW6068943.1 nucleoside triphosphate pyrophosphohydrolase [Clostridium sporogenes]NFF64300.1 nucleoside triphosphate pyrophosphohydrolase [Clostridium sporogenes]PHH02349.1 nucleoside triphosphate pyrophosphohydrolase [Clostridium sporogenes]
MINIIGLGPGSKESITLGTIDSLKTVDKVFLRTEKHPTVEYINKLGIVYETFDEKYETGESFDEVYNSIAKSLIDYSNNYSDIIYAVPGHPLVAEKSVNILIKLCKENNIEFKIVPAVSFVDALMESLLLDPVEGLKIIDAFDIKNQVMDKRIGTVITQVYDKFIASEVKLNLMNYYKDDTEIFFVRAAGIEGLEEIRKIPLYELDRQHNIDHLTSVYIPKVSNNNYDFMDLLDIMDKLRGEEGCPWDKEQTHTSLKKYLIEESYEVIEAIDNKDVDMLIEELGDVLLQVIFHSQIGKEEGFFEIKDVIQSICDKMINRHPHVFSDLEINNSNEVLENWDKIKSIEQGNKTYTDSIRHIAKTLPALMRADKVQKKAAKVGFDWDNIEDAMKKIIEEYKEIEDVYKSKNKVKILEEIGDLLFSVVNVARFLDIDPENALNYSIDKFINRFQYIEDESISMGRNLDNMSLEEMDELWKEAKNK